MIILENISKQFDSRVLLKKINLSIFPNEKIGLTGPNGMGKTTVFSIILGETEPSGGTVTIQKNIRIGYLPQEACFHSSRTVLEEVIFGDERMAKLLAEKRRLEEENKADSMRYGDIMTELETMGIYELEPKAQKVLAGLGFQPRDVERPVATLSGGWQMRTLLAKLLVHSYDCLLLDEPTNHLDLNATLWLKEFLSSYQGTFVLISHDKVFLNAVTNYTIVLDFGQLIKVKGNYRIYEQQKEERRKSLEKKKKQLDKRRAQLERFTQRFHAQPNRAAAVRNKRKMIERMEQIDLPEDIPSIEDFSFPQPPRSGYTVISLEKVKKSFGYIAVYQDLDLEIIRGQKVCLVGPNGAGKSTLLKMMAGVISPDSGKIKLGHNVKVGYFSQARLDVLNPHNTAFDEVASAAPGNIPAVQVRNLLGLFHFHGDDVFKPISVLSGGEKSRVILAKLLINPPNFILLDEPTTHLDIDGVDALTSAFKKYEGTLCFISHDLYFVQEIADHIIEVHPGGKIRSFPGKLDYYLDKKEEEAGPIKKEALKEKKEKKEKKASQEKSKDKSAKTQKAKSFGIAAELHRKHKEAKKRIASIKKKIKALENERTQLEAENYVKTRVIAKSTSARDPELLKEYGQRLKFIKERLDQIDDEILQLMEEKEAIEKGH